MSGAAALFKTVSRGAIWLFLLTGGQDFPYRDRVLAEPSVLFGMPVVSLRFRHERLIGALHSSGAHVPPIDEA